MYCMARNIDGEEIQAVFFFNGRCEMKKIHSMQKCMAVFGKDKEVGNTKMSSNRISNR